ncbi:MAG: HIT family hydrolase [Sulfuricurvum sp. GWF2_44_89]|uniref:HIT family protein n=1 Tax=Sulfuricurvum kujiense TaxID=148813 RepID=A0A2D3WBW0_9BACT|nr:MULTISPECIES: HIT domain-containing protein [Sulfuricurvum]OHD77077.1 MAG: HIT family hydrolase [Sulfuricurvum sp. GWF2_44_89]OHD90477.1 MAG: HIT family hydrolase [Sulfuricurvum sp. RIFOXYD12_FULL_44_77]OHD92453.1 MAG: HIT family hydrolase [Sulfuricurvum sp. RIFOXYD2_FULL_44_160]DAB37385.1 MAG TPA: HIT family protein [Sulfuricurvum kujiense]
MMYSNSLIYIELHESEIPWLKIFTHAPHKEFSECSREEKKMIWDALDIIEKEMLVYFKPTKINIASFGNMVPRVHWHIMGRFENDSYFPEPMWGMKQREGFELEAPMEPFLEKVKREINSRLN